MALELIKFGLIEKKIYKQFEFNVCTDRTAQNSLRVTLGIYILVGRIYIIFVRRSLREILPYYGDP